MGEGSVICAPPQPLPAGRGRKRKRKRLTVFPRAGRKRGKLHNNRGRLHLKGKKEKRPISTVQKKRGGGRTSYRRERGRFSGEKEDYLLTIKKGESTTVYITREKSLSSRGKKEDRYRR